MLGQILQQAQSFDTWIAYLKSQSDYYPKVLVKERPRPQQEKKREHPDYPIIRKLVAALLKKKKPTLDTKEIYLSTLVRICRDNKWYTVHCVESAIFDYEIQQTNEYLFKKFMDYVYKIQNLYIISGYEDVDTLQISEEERLKKLILG